MTEEKDTIKSLITFQSKRLREDFDEYITSNEQVRGYSTDFYIIKIDGKDYYSGLSSFEIIWRLSFYFDQIATATCQHGDIAIVNQDSSHNTDTPVSENCGLHQCWFNACVSERIDPFSRMEL